MADGACSETLLDDAASLLGSAILIVLIFPPPRAKRNNAQMSNAGPPRNSRLDRGDRRFDTRTTVILSNPVDAFAAGLPAGVIIRKIGWRLRSRAAIVRLNSKIVPRLGREFENSEALAKSF